MSVSYRNFLFAFGLSKLYTNSLLSTLNARSPLGGAPTGTGELPSGVNIRSRPVSVLSPLIPRDFAMLMSAT